MPGRSSVTAGMRGSRSTMLPGALWPASGELRLAERRVPALGTGLRRLSCSTRPPGSLVSAGATSRTTPSSVEHVIFALRGAARVRGLRRGPARRRAGTRSPLGASSPRPVGCSGGVAAPPRGPRELSDEPMTSAARPSSRQPRARSGCAGRTGPAVHFLEVAGRTARSARPRCCSSTRCPGELFGGENAIRLGAASRTTSASRRSSTGSRSSTNGYLGRQRSGGPGWGYCRWEHRPLSSESGSSRRSIAAPRPSPPRSSDGSRDTGASSGRPRAR